MTSKYLIVAAVILAGSVAAWAQQKPFTPPQARKILSHLRAGHPRLVLTNERLAELKQLAKSDKLLSKAVGDVIRQADALARKPELVYHLVGPRLLRVSRDCVNRMYAYGLAWRWTGKKKYLDKARATMLAVAAFKDWHPPHFLDTAEMTHGMAIGYDWFYDALDEPTRETVREAIVRLGLGAGLHAYQHNAWWHENRFNWNQVCNMGLSIGALAVADTDPEPAGQILENAFAGLPHALGSYAPDGAWGEGPGYWSYATRYTAYGLAAMRTALGTDFGLSDIPGLEHAGYFPLYETGPTGLMFGYADAHTPVHRRNLPELLLLAQLYDNPFFAQAERKVIAERPASPMDVIWYLPAKTKPVQADLARLFRGPVPSAVFRTSWNDPDALFVAFKAGYNRVNHGHLDLGQFVLDALGVRWLRDLGSDNYNLPNYWGSNQNATRWTYYRLGSSSHNIVTLDGDNQNVDAVTKITDFRASGKDGFAVADLTSAYTPKASKALRGVRLVNGRAVLVQDELQITKACEVVWGVTTDATVSADGATARLKLEGKTLTAHILAPKGASFAVESAEQKPPQATNEGVSRLVIRTAVKPGAVRLAVLLVPRAKGAAGMPKVAIVPLAEWSAPVPTEPAPGK